MEGTFIDGLYWESRSHGPAAGNGADDTGFILYENKLLGVPRFVAQNSLFDWTRPFLTEGTFKKFLSIVTHAGLKQTRPDTRLPQSRAVGRGCF